MCWLDDQFLVSGSKDTKLALWRINEELLDAPDNDVAEEQSCPTYGNIVPVSVKECRAAQKVLVFITFVLNSF